MKTDLKILVGIVTSLTGTIGIVFSIVMLFEYLWLEFGISLLVSCVLIWGGWAVLGLLGDD